MREIKESMSVDNATKDPQFINGFFSSPGGDDDTPQPEVEKQSPSKVGQNSEGAKTEPDANADGKSGAVATDPEEKMATGGNEVQNNSYYEDVFERRKRWGKNIAVYRLVNGKF